MVLAYVLISAGPGKEREVYESIKDKVIEVHPLFGEFDLIAKFEAESFNHIGEFVVDHVRQTPGIVDTKTLTCIDDWF